MSTIRTEGERAGDRAIIDKHTRELIEAGADPRKAREVARQAMIEADRVKRRQGKR